MCAKRHAEAVTRSRLLNGDLDATNDVAPSSTEDGENKWLTGCASCCDMREEIKTLVSPRRSVVVDGESIYDQVFRAGDLDSDGRWNLQEFNRIQVKMEHDPLEESQNPGTLHTCWR